MLFSSETFLFVFLPVLIILYYSLIHFPIKVRNILLLLASLLFYAWGTPKYIGLMIYIIILTWFYGIILGNVKSNVTLKIMLFLAIASYVVIFGYFKYRGFLAENINFIFGMNWVIPELVLPLGISFYIFQAISYIVDVYRGKIEVQKNLLYLGLYITFFPQLIAGPIVRYEAIGKQIVGRKEKKEDFAKGICRFIIGLAKKVIIANNIAIVADYAFALIYENAYYGSTVMAWIGAMSYTLQIFFDFSGYSDMAIGLAKMFGFHLEENFNYPYISKSISEFWRRWHMSLQTWFRDYIYIPLGGNKSTNKLRNIFNIFVVWILTGIWHGASWNFVLWGLFNCAFILFEKKINKKSIGHVYALLVIVFGWVIFRSSSIHEAMIYIAAMLGNTQNGIIDTAALMNLKQNAIYYVLAIIFSTPCLPKLDERFNKNRIWNGGYAIGIILVFCVSIIFILNQAYDPFIYFNF